MSAGKRKHLILTVEWLQQLQSGCIPRHIAMRYEPARSFKTKQGQKR